MSKALKHYLPSPEALRKHKHLRFCAQHLHDPNLFHLNRRSLSSAFASGLFWAMMPIPMQMLAAAVSAIVLRINLPVSVALVWISNPFTMPPIFYFNYLVGTWILGAPPDIGDFQMSVEWISQQLGAIWLPLYFGSLVVGIILGMLGYITVRLYWRWNVISKLQARARKRELIKKTL